MEIDSEKSITIFYSWESDLPPKYNKIAIRSSLTQAISLVDEEITDPDLKILYDEATNREPGSPNIPATILKKISNSDIFIADISTINSLSDASQRKAPNPNVIFELGYAVAMIGWERIVLIFNEKYGNFKADAPFDIDRQRTMFFSFDDKTENVKAVKSGLIGDLKIALKTIIQNNPDRPSEKVKISPEQEKRRRDINNLTWILTTVHFPTISHQIEEGPKFIYDRYCFFWEEFNAIYSTPLFHIYDTRLFNLLNDFHLHWQVSVEAGSHHYYATSNNRSVFLNTGDMPLNPSQQKAWDDIQRAYINLNTASNNIIKYINEDYLEVDLSLLEKSAWSNYVEFNREKKDILKDFCTAPDCLDQRLASRRLLGFPSLAGLVGCESAQLFEPPGAVV